MSFETETNQKFAQIFQAFEQLNSNAKKTDEFNEQTTLVPTSKIRVSNNGNTEKLEVSKILDFITGGLEKWSEKIYDKQVAVVYNDIIYMLSDAISLPYNSTDFIVELNNNIWIQLNQSKIIEVTASRNYQESDNGNIVVVKADVTLTLTSTLPANFNCVVYVMGNYTLTNPSIFGLTILPLSSSTLAGEKMQSIFRLPSSDTFIIAGENS